jgi:antitoxin component YwqK of YwqJK toxin-antitoxin module
MQKEYSEGLMDDTISGYKVPFLFILVSVLFVSAVVIITPIISTVYTIDEASFRIVVRSGLIYKLGEDSPYSGRIIDTLESKIIKYDVLDGLKNGEFSISTLEGNFSVRGYVEKNKNVGSWEYYYDDGRLESVGSFEDDKPQGNWIWYYKSGKVKSKGNYLSGKAEGSWFKYDERGNLKLMIYYSNGEIVNEVKFILPQYI